MAFSTITMVVVGAASNPVSNANSATVTLTTTDAATAKNMAQSIIKNGGAWADDGVFYPATAILKIGVS